MRLNLFSSFFFTVRILEIPKHVHVKKRSMVQFQKSSLDAKCSWRDTYICFGKTPLPSCWQSFLFSDHYWWSIQAFMDQCYQVLNWRQVTPIVVLSTYKPIEMLSFPRQKVATTHSPRQPATDWNCPEAHSGFAGSRSFKCSGRS